jgi:hypothetical protein
MEYPAGGIVSKVLSTDGGRAEVEDLLAAAKASVTQMLDEHRSVVESLRDALLEREELIGDDILAVIRGSHPNVVASDREPEWPPGALAGAQSAMAPGHSPD